MTDDLEATQAAPPTGGMAGTPGPAADAVGTGAIPGATDGGPATVEIAGPVAAPTTVVAPATVVAPTTVEAPGPTAALGPASAPPPTAGASGSRRVLGTVRSISVGVAFVLACLSLLLATTTWWLHDTVLSTDNFVALTAPLAEDPAIQAALTEATAEQLDRALDLGPIGRYVVSGVAGEVYASDQFAAVWAGLMRSFHAQVVGLLRNEQSIASIEDGQLVLNLFPVIAAITERVNALNLAIGDRTLQLPTLTDPEDPEISRAELEAALGRTLAPGFGIVAIGEAERLTTAQRYVTLFDALVVVLFVITAALALITLALARRRIRMIALLAVGGLATLLAARLIIASAADAIATEVAAGGPAAIIGGEAIAQVADSYRAFAGGILLIGLIVAIGGTVVAWLLERSAAKAGDRRVTSLADGWFLVLAGLCAALVALLALGLTWATLAILGLAYLAWLVVVVVARRRDRSTATA